jgi:hypothetical protein
MMLHMVMVLSGISLVIYMSVNGLMDSNMVMVFSIVLREEHLKDNGRMINNMEKVWKNGLMGKFTKEITWMEK